MTVLVVDTETTGIQPPVIPVEVYLAELLGSPADFSIGEVFYSLFNPGRPIELGAKATHHILDSILQNAPPYENFTLGDDLEYIIGHNVDFDADALGTALPESVKRIDTLSLARSLWPALDNHRLGTVVYALLPEAEAREALTGAHGAMVDATNTITILGYMIKALNPRSWEELYGMSEIARLPERMTFGKHGPKSVPKYPGDGLPGVPLKDLDQWDPGYRSWLLKQKDLDKYLRRALDTYR